MLIVIDMQPYFKASSNRETMAAVLRQIRLAKRRKVPIIVVEYNPDRYGGTHDVIVDAVKNYPQAITLSKFEDDGSYLLAWLIKQRELPAERIRVCGVNTNACVMSTCLGLANKLPLSKINVIASACNGHEKYEGWASDAPNVEWVA